MQSRNPVFARAEGFNGRANAYGNQTYAGNGQAYAGYGQVDATGMPVTHAGAGAGRMTVDSVVQKTGITLLVVFVAAAITWISTGDITASGAAGKLYTLAIVGSMGGFALSMVNSFKRVISPGLVIAYAAFEGVAIGAFSKAIETSLPSTVNPDGTVQSGYHGVVIMAVLGTFVAVGATLAVYKFFNIRVGNKFRTWVMAAAWGFVGLSVLDFVLGMFHSDFGFNNPFSPFAILISFVGLAIGIFMLILDFDFVERGVAAGLPERESWRAAFGLTVTIVWIYIEMLRLAAELTRR